jgi:CcmD family protein
MGVVVLALGAVAAAQQSSGFVPATDIQKETLPALPLLYAAYAFVWVVLLAYVALLWRRLSKVERELAEVTAKLGSRK